MRWDNVGEQGKLKGKSYDRGSKASFLAANIAYAMDRENLLVEMKKYI